MSYYCRVCPAIIEEDTLDLCPRCLASLCEHCHGEGVEPDAGTDSNPEPQCRECLGECVTDERMQELRADRLRNAPIVTLGDDRPCVG